jgi:3-deoxy-manno-octulosonate cytidylyltransferase (CMP-KDO synthetase)
MKKIAFIPARFAATRFPAKLLQQLGSKTVIRHTYDNTVATGLFDDVIVVTDSEEILQEITKHGGKAIMSKRQHESGSDRIAEAVENMEVDVIVNVQGDEPFVHREPLNKLLRTFEDTSVHVASLMKKIDERAALDPNNVKVVVDGKGHALYFSRSMIPFHRDKGSTVDYYLHLGIYAYRKQTLLAFTKWAPSLLETTERLEQLRYLENGVRIRMIETQYQSIAIDTPQDLLAALKMLK